MDGGIPIDTWPLDMDHKEYIDNRKFKLKPMTFFTSLGPRMWISWKQNVSIGIDISDDIIGAHETRNVMTEMTTLNNKNYSLGIAHDDFFLEEGKLHAVKDSLDDYPISEFQQNIPSFIKLPYPVNFADSRGLEITIKYIGVEKSHELILIVDYIQRIMTFDSFYKHPNDQKKFVNKFGGMELNYSTQPTLNTVLTKHKGTDVELGAASMWLGVACGIAQAKGCDAVLLQDAARGAAGEHVLEFFLPRFVKNQESIYVKGRTYKHVKALTYNSLGYASIHEFYTPAEITIAKNVFSSISWDAIKNSKKQELIDFVKAYTNTRKAFLEWIENQDFYSFTSGTYEDPAYEPVLFKKAVEAFIDMLPHVKADVLDKTINPPSVRAMFFLRTAIVRSHYALDKTFNKDHKAIYMEYTKTITQKEIYLYLHLNANEKEIRCRPVPDTYDDI